MNCPILFRIYEQNYGLEGRCFLVARSVSTPVLQTRMTDQNQICSNGRASTVTDVLARPCKWQTPFSEQDDASKRIVNKFQKLAILQLNIEVLTASKMSILDHLASQREALVILFQETHCTFAQRFSCTGLPTSWVLLNQEAWPCYVCL